MLFAKLRKQSPGPAVITMSDTDYTPHNAPEAFAPAKNRFISDLSLGEEVADIFIISTAQQGQSRNGPYWRLEFRDASGGVPGKIWSPQSQAYPDLTTGMAVWIKARVTSYRDKLELVVDSLRVLGEEEKTLLDMALFMPASSRSPDAMLADLKEMARVTLTHKPWRKLITSILEDREISAALRLAPAAKAMHHAYAGGLLEHTLSVTGLCMKLADQYPDLDRQALFAGAVCHDLGKLWELSSGLSIDYTTTGRLLGHISLLLEKLSPFIKKSNLEPELVEHLQHMILSHHGTHEFGSPQLPSTAEALALHYADIIDAKLHQVEAAISGLEENSWSAYNVPLERFLYRAVKTPAPLHRSDAEKNTAKQTGRRSATPVQEEPVQPLSLFSQCSLLSKE